MTIKSLLFSLFIYVSLGWVGAALLYPGSVRDAGLLWTAAGLLAVLLFIVGARLFGWWRLKLAKAAVRPAATARPQQAVHEDDSALAALIAEANANLAKVAAYAGKEGKTPLSSLPLSLLVGPEGSGKTSTFLNSGLEPQLLAGQVAGATPVVSTRLCNLWLAKDAIFAEIAGRAFSGDLNRWTQLLRVLRGYTPERTWRRLWSEPRQRAALAGVIAFCEVKTFTGTLNAERLTRHSRDWQERLGAIGEAFGTEYPVYQVLTKCDAIAFFEDYFHRLPEPEGKQVLGCTLPPGEADMRSPGAVFAEVETKRLNQSFSPLFQSLAKRRLTHLAHEPDPARRPGIYEFPREFKRIRSSLVQFLTDVFRPQVLRPGALLRGYYLTGVREVEAAMAAEIGATRADWSAAEFATDATRLFRGDATQIFRAGDLNPKSGSGHTLRWMFSSDLFHQVILQDQPVPKAVPIDSRMDFYRRCVVAGTCLFCGLLCLAWIWSWIENRTLLNRVASAGQPVIGKHDKAANLADLRSLEDLRVEVADLSNNQRSGAPIPLRWGLYSGNRVLEAARTGYFRRFQELILNDINGVWVSNLAGVPANPGANDPDEQATYQALKAHLMISSGACKADPVFAAQALKQAAAQAGLTAGVEANDLISRQIDFYANELPNGNPCRVAGNVAAENRARQYLSKVKGVERIYANILARAKALPALQRLADFAPNYSLVLAGPGEISAAFSKEGWKFVEHASKERNADALGESCVVGNNAGLATDWRRDAQLEREVQRRFFGDYIAQWRKFFTSFSVNRYAGPEDAAHKLDILAGHKSPLLALFAMTANQTSFPSAASEPEGFADKAIKEGAGILSKWGKAGKTVAKGAEATLGTPEAIGTPADIARSFQPVHWVVPPSSDKWVNDKNGAYIDGLAQLSHSLQEIVRAGTDPAVHQAANQSYEKALDAAKQIAKGFQPVGVDGLDSSVERLLEAPILLAKPYILTDLDKAAAGKVNAELRIFCGRLRSIVGKYPFQTSASQEVTLPEFSAWFAPTTGEIWKFQAQTLADSTVREGSWKTKDPAKKPQVTPEMLDFLNHAQLITDAFFPAGATQPQFTFTLRPKLDGSFRALDLELYGQVHEWTSTSSLQTQFSWPAPVGSKELGAVLRIKVGEVTFPVASRGGTWGLFRILEDAEARTLSAKIIEWKKVRGGDGRLEPIQPAPVRLEIVEFPGGVDVFNPKFFEALHCPAGAVR